jgi:pyruvate/2-oxoglutarate dehydrogenase complex dihydrolipoamide acyltransferase (E2) component
VNRALFAGASIVAVGLSVALTYASLNTAIPVVRVVPLPTGPTAASTSDGAKASPSAPPTTTASAEASLPLLAPQPNANSVRLGIVFVQYAGAQDAPTTARAKDAAAELAKRLAEEAARDFHAAVGKGDSGSGDDLGSFRRGVLDSATEALVFALAVGQTSAPLETPRGFWIVKRLE